eukprot:12612370-Alexandrium_andersonii.AAC.1
MWCAGASTTMCGCAWRDLGSRACSLRRTSRPPRAGEHGPVSSAQGVRHSGAVRGVMDTGSGLGAPGAWGQGERARACARGRGALLRADGSRPAGGACGLTRL